MIELKQYIEESLLDDFDTLASKIDAEDAIKQYLRNNYWGCKDDYIEMRLGEDGKYIVDLYNDLTPRKIKLKEITNGLFVFGTIRGCVDFEGTQISSLEGSPREVQGFFDCSYCPNLTSLEGAPDYVRDSFYCTGNSKLKSLKGGPKMVDGGFYCADCGKKFKEKDIMNAKIIVQGGINI
jgi:hypothetical protein